MLVGIEPVRSGYVVRSEQRIHWQEFGAGPMSVLLLPTWSIVHSDLWRHQVPSLSERYRVITFDGLGNGMSDRPLDPIHYGDLQFADDGAAVLDACGVDRAAIVGESQRSVWALAMAARHPGRVTAAVFIAPNVLLAPGHAFEAELPEYAGWSKWNMHYWREDFPGFLRFFFSKCFTEPDSQPQIDHFFDMGIQTTPDVLLATGGTDEHNLNADTTVEYARMIRCPALVLHGDEDAITPLARGAELARVTNAEFVIKHGGGHVPQYRFPAEMDALLGGFLARSLDA